MEKTIMNKTLLLIPICLLLFACSKVTQGNFDKIKPNMSVSEVTAILGEPTSSDSINVAGISGTATTWKSNNAEIDIQFVNDKVIAKSFNKSSQDKSERANTQ
jgi:hypothetical protein